MSFSSRMKKRNKHFLKDDRKNKKERNNESRPLQSMFLTQGKISTTSVTRSQAESKRITPGVDPTAEG